ncbi:MAG: winged helix DNA-binding protein [Pseudomonadota bacterium]|nr:winged helix DNA-binding protein [Pseudomonadota bacterium]
MSTKLTTQAAQEALPEPLTVLLETASQSVLQSLTARLRAGGFDTITESHLVLFGNLDCGATHAAQIAHRMQVSRQAISKTLRELQALGFIQLDDDHHRRNQKLVVMTKRGTQLALAARAELRDIETAIANEIGAYAMAALRDALEKGWGNAVGPKRATAG